MSFPARIPRRLRAISRARELAQETTLTSSNLICPIVVQDGLKSKVRVDLMPEIERLPLGEISDEVGTIADLGIPAVMIFGIPKDKDDAGTSAFDGNGIVQKTIAQIRENFGEKIVVMSDVCLCQYTPMSHCGILSGDKIDNDKSVEALVKIAVSHAKAGVDTVSPSAMMDGQVAAIRTALDDEGFTDVSIMPQSAKHSSSLYSPFRNAAKYIPKLIDKKTYQVPFTNAREVMMEIESDINEGADIVMIKPALAYLDLIAETKRRFNAPVAAYSVSGEYAMIKAAAMEGWINEKDVTAEILYSIKRAGADMIVTYFAKSAAAEFLTS